MLLDAGGITKGWEKKKSLKEVHILSARALLSVICSCSFLHIFTDVSLEVMKHFDSEKGHFIVMLNLIHPTDHGVMKEPTFLIRYAIWISIGCHASYPIRQWQAAFPVDVQSVICQPRVLMKRKTYEESYIQTDGKCNFHTPQPYVQRFPYWFLIKDSTWNFTSAGSSYETGGTLQIRRVQGIVLSRSFASFGFLNHTDTNKSIQKEEKKTDLKRARAI